MLTDKNIQASQTANPEPRSRIDILHTRRLALLLMLEIGFWHNASTLLRESRHGLEVFYIAITCAILCIVGGQDAAVVMLLTLPGTICFGLTARLLVEQLRRRRDHLGALDCEKQQSFPATEETRSPQ